MPGPLIIYIYTLIIHTTTPPSCTPEVRYGSDGWRFSCGPLACRSQSASILRIDNWSIHDWRGQKYHFYFLNRPTRIPLMQRMTMCFSTNLRYESGPSVTFILCLFYLITWIWPTLPLAYSLYTPESLTVAAIRSIAWFLILPFSLQNRRTRTPFTAHVFRIYRTRAGL